MTFNSLVWWKITKSDNTELLCINIWTGPEGRVRHRTDH